jgi:hypothetical protein
MICKGKAGPVTANGNALHSFDVRHRVVDEEFVGVGRMAWALEKKRSNTNKLKTKDCYLITVTVFRIKEGGKDDNPGSGVGTCQTI